MKANQNFLLVHTVVQFNPKNSFFDMLSRRVGVHSLKLNTITRIGYVSRNWRIKAWFSSMTPTNRRLIDGTQRILLVSNDRQWNSPSVRVIWKPGFKKLQFWLETKYKIVPAKILLKIPMISACMVKFGIWLIKSWWHNGY